MMADRELDDLSARVRELLAEEDVPHPACRQLVNRAVALLIALVCGVGWMLTG